MNPEYEKEKICEYVFNAVFNDIFLRDNFSLLCNSMMRIGEKLDIVAPRKFDEDEEAPKEQGKQKSFLKTFKQDSLKGIRLLQEYAQNILNKESIHSDGISAFEQNLIYLQQILNLSDLEKEMLGFLVRAEENRVLKTLLRKLDDDDDMIRNTTAFLKAPKSDVCAINSKEHILVKLSFMDESYHSYLEASSLARSFYYKQFSCKEDVEQYLVGHQTSASLEWEDFNEMTDAPFVEKILSGALKTSQQGINILFYGEPGTGKTEFAKTVAQRIGAKLYAIENNETIVGRKHDYESIKRYQQLLCANKLLEKDSASVFLIDEANDILGTSLVSKIKTNRLLETNQRPVIWIINDIDRLDNAYMRRFTYIVKFKRPQKTTLQRIWQKNLKQNQLDYNDEMIERFIKKYSIPPSFVSCATKATRLMNGSMQEMEHILDSLEQAYSGEDNDSFLKETTCPSDSFNLDLLNTDVDLDNLSKRIVSLNKLNFSLCLYGVSGTGKSAFAQYLGQALKMPVIKKRCSDLLSKWVGESEKQIAQAFHEAKREKAILIFDEADSFLQNRENAQRSWEITQVNEMLTQMERHNYPFVCTTNLMDHLDKAALRRFTFKVKYDYLTPEKLTRCFEHFFQIKDVDLSDLSLLTPGDFVVVKQKAEILDLLNDKEELIRMLEMEQQNKAPVSRRIGFL